MVTDVVYSEADYQAADAARILLATRKARAGDPFDWIEYQWGRIFYAKDIVANPSLLSEIYQMRERKQRYLILDDFQVDMIRSIFDPSIREVYVKGNTGCGKGGAAGIIICTYYCIYPDARIVITRDSYKKAVNVMFAEVDSWWRKMRYTPPFYELQATGVTDKNSKKHEVVISSPKTGEGFSGSHSPHVLYVFDEATAPVLNGRYSLANTQSKKFLAMANPRTTSGKFRAGFDLADEDEKDKSQTLIGPYGRRRLITIGGNDCLNVKMKCLQDSVSPKGGIEIGGRRYEPGQLIDNADMVKVEPIIPGQTTYDTFLGHLENPDPFFVRTFAHGKFPDEDPDKQLIFRRWLKEPNRLWKKWHKVHRKFKEKAIQGRLLSSHVPKVLNSMLPVEAFGLDVGASTNGDASVLTAGGKNGIREQLEDHIDDAEGLADWVVDSARKHYRIDLKKGSHPVGVDMDGIGWGVVSILKKRGVKVVEVRGNATPEVDPKRYANLRAENYGELAKRLNEKGQWKGLPFLMPPSDALELELTAPEKIMSSDGFKFAISPKRKVTNKENQPESVHEKIGRSPDRADSAVYFYRALRFVGVSLDSILENEEFF
ncbi:hypothetical protein [Gimesia fumaroli]|uniref:Terminase-like family protein n=1 Tax=Gimesia fumaroli TaxID=2527976 RepID=A0A518I8X5_9PLAN|nr:hypothetical protein [Gimesia fumaroli]QDV49547.1 hypothetical protein Enr17x_15670 [Gimesia fumaroli]